MFFQTLFSLCETSATVELTGGNELLSSPKTYNTLESGVVLFCVSLSRSTQSVLSVSFRQSLCLSSCVGIKGDLFLWVYKWCPHLK